MKKKGIIISIIISIIILTVLIFHCGLKKENKYDNVDRLIAYVDGRKTGSIPTKYKSR